MRRMQHAPAEGQRVGSIPQWQRQRAQLVNYFWCVLAQSTSDGFIAHSVCVFKRGVLASDIKTYVNEFFAN
jgi:hypothetical protein